MQYFKVLAEGGKSCHGGDADWRPGEWMPTIDNLEPCMRGYHLCEARDLVDWLGLEIWIAEARGEIIRSKNKTVVSGARIIQKLDNWTDRNARLFACDCAEHVLPIWAKQYPSDDRPAQAIVIARKYVDGQATLKELAAARAAAWAARDAAWAARDAAWAAAWAAAWDAAWAAAWDAAWDAARDAAWNAARDAAWDAERRWQTERLMEILNIVGGV
jgi:hypothetical protein